VTTIGSDHCCYDLDQKRSRRTRAADAERAARVETRLPVIFSEYVVRRGLPATRFVELTAAIRRGRTGSTRGRQLLPGADATW